MSDSRLIPRDEGAERSLVGCCLLDSRVLDTVLLQVRAEMFFEEPSREVFSAIVGLHQANKAVDVVTVAKALRARKRFEDVGGAAFLNELIGSVPHTVHHSHYADIVRGDWIRREAIIASEQIGTAMRDPSRSPEEAIANADSRMMELVDSIDSGASCQEIGSLLIDLEDCWKQPADERAGLPAHIGNLTDIVGGFRDGNLVVIAARPSVGKTALALNLICRWCKNKSSVLLFSAEQSKLEIAERLLALHVGASIHDLQNGRVDNLRLESARSEMSEWKLFVDDRGQPSILQVEAMSRLYRRKQAIEAVVIDYLQLIEPIDRKIPREQQVAMISGRLKSLAKSLNIPVVVLAQLNRQSESRENKRPRLSDLRESGAVEQDADKAILLWRQYMDEPGHAEHATAVAIVAKNRNGPIGDAQMIYRAHCFQFAEAAGGYAKEPHLPVQDDW